MKTKQDKLVSWDAHIDHKYGKAGSNSRAKYEEEFEAFKLGLALTNTQGLLPEL